MKTKQRPNIILCTGTGSNTEYVFNGVFGADNKRRPTFTKELEKARRFHDETEAKNFISRCVPNKREYRTETYEPATQPI